MVNVGSHIFEDNLEPGRIYFFKNKELTSDAPHFHILIVIPNNDLLILTCCTSQFEKLVASKLYEDAKISTGQAVEIVGLSKRAFIKMIGKYGVAVFQRFNN